MREPCVDAFRTALSEGLPRDGELRRAYADLRETCASVLDPRHADRDLARLLARHPGGESPVSGRFEAVLTRLPRGLVTRAREHPAATGITIFEVGPLLADGLETLLRDELGMSLGEVGVLDPWAGDGSVLAALAGARRSGNVADPVAYTDAVRLGKGICLADSFRLPERGPTPGFAFSDDENTERIAHQQTVEFAVVVSDLRQATAPDARARRRVRDTYGTGLAAVRWMSDRVAPRGIVAFVSDGAFVDEPSTVGMRAAMEREFSGVVHIVLGEGLSLTFLVRGGRRGPIRYRRLPTMECAFTEIEWRELEPTPTHVWRTEILAPEWASFLPLVGEREAIFLAESAGAPNGRDAAVPGAKGARRVMRRPFAPAWRVLDRAARREPWPPDEPTVVVLSEPFGVVATSGSVDRRFGRAPVRAVSGVVSPTALRRFRTAYGAGVVERDVFDFALALLHHPDYPIRYREDLRRGVPRIPLVSPERLETLSEIEGAPPVGLGAAFGTGWLDSDDFEPGSVPDYDDPFASPYARTDVEPGFLLLCGLGAALYRVQAGFERLLPYPLERVDTGVFDGKVERMRLSSDGTRLLVRPGLTLAGVPPEASRYWIGDRSALAWAVDAHRKGRNFDPNDLEDPERIVRLVGKVVAASLETERLAKIIGTIVLQ